MHCYWNYRNGDLHAKAASDELLSGSTPCDVWPQRAAAGRRRLAVAGSGGPGSASGASCTGAAGADLIQH